MRLRTFGPHCGGALTANDRPRGRRVRPPSSSRACFSTGRGFPRLREHEGESAGAKFRNSTRRVASTTNWSRAQRERNYQHKTVALVLQSSADELLRAGIPEPTASVCHVLAKVLRLPWESGYRDIAALLARSRRLPPSGDTLSSRTLSAEESEQYADLMMRRLRHEPIQYLVGQWDFLDSTYRIRAPLLCPRAETEELVLHAERDVRRLTAPSEVPATEIRVLDVGCGTGCVGISLLDRLWRKPPAFGGIRVHAIDVERTAVEVSLDNARRILEKHGVRVATDEEPVDPGPLSCSYTARLCDLRRFDPSERFHVVVSNPPYVPMTDRDTLERNVRDFESPAALFGGGPDGMDVIRDLVRKLPAWCHSNAVCWMEVDPSHPALLQEWIDEQEPSVRTKVTLDDVQCDMFGRQRFVRLLVNPTTDCDKADFLASHQ